MADLSYKNDDDVDERLNPADLHTQEQRAAFDNEFNDERMSKDGIPGDLSGGKKGPSLNEQEEKSGSSGWTTNLTPGGKNQKAKFLTKRNAKRLSPLAGLLVTITAALIGVSITAPTLLLEEIKNVFTGDLNKSNAALNIRARAVLKFKADGVKNGFAETSDGVCGVACKLGTVSDAFVAKMKAVGFDVDVNDTKIPGRSIINSITFPADPGDSTKTRLTVTNGDDFIAAMDGDPLKAAAFSRAINLSSIFLLNSRFQTILTGLGLNKGAQTSGDTEEEIKDSENTELGQDETPADTSDANLNAASDAIGSTRAAPVIESASFSEINEKLSGKANIVGAVCTGYDVIKGIELSDALAKQGAFIAFAWTFLNAADQQEYGDGSQAQASALGTQLTSSDTNKTVVDSSGNTITNPYYGESATDSAGYKEAAYQDNPGTLSEPQQKFSISPLGVIAVLATITSIIGKPGNASTTALTATCSPEAQAGLTTAACLTDAGIASAIPGIGTAAAAGLCAVGNLAAPQVIGAALSPILGTFIKKIAEFDLPKIAASTVGGEAGDAIFAGSSSLFNITGESYGMSLATSSSQVAAYAVDTSSIQNEEATIAKAQARSNPLDIYNQYSFLGSIAQSINFSAFSSSSIGSSLSVLASIIPTSFADLFSPTNAATTAQTNAQKEAALYASACTNPSLASIGAACDAYGYGTPVLDSTSLNMDITSNLNYMFNNGYVDPTTGAASGDYSYWVTNCGNRSPSLPLGETSDSISDVSDGGAGYEWAVGAYCEDGASGIGAPTQNELDNFRTYWMDSQASDTVENP